MTYLEKLRKKYESSNDEITRRALKELIIKEENSEYLTKDSIVGVVNYLISLYYRTDLKYCFYPAKINRLLTIYKLCSLKYNNKALKEGLIILSDGRMGAHHSIYSAFDNRFCPPTVLEEDSNEITEEIKDYESDKIYISRNYIAISQEVSRRFCYNFDIQKELEISEESRNLLELIFRKFGNYSTQELGPIIDEIVSKLPIEKIKEHKYFEQNEVFNVFIDNNKRYLKDNIVFNFVKNFDRHNIDKFCNNIEDCIEPKPQENNTKAKRKSIFNFWGNTK